MPVYNNPAFAQAAENLAKLFAPPSSSDVANYALAAERNQKASQLARLFQEAPDWDRRAIAADLYDPTNSLGAQNQNDATARRGQDITASTSLTNNAADNKRAFLTTMFGPLAQGEIRPEVPAAITAPYSLPELPAAAGAPKPLSETELVATILGGLPPDEQRAVATKGVNVSPIVTPEGPRNVSIIDAIGEEPFVNKGAEAKATNALARLRDGTKVPAVQGPDGRWNHAQTGAALPSDIEVFDMPKPQGTSEELGLSKPAQSQIDRQLIDISVAKNTAVKLRDLIQTSPASQGAVGWIRGTAQNVLQTGGELGTYFGGGIADVQQSIEAGLADADLAGAFDPNIPAIEMMSNLLAFQYAKTTTGERLSNEMLRATKAALGLDRMTSNQADSIARMNQAVKMIEDQENILRGVRQNGLGTGGASSGPGSPANPAPGVPPTITTPEEYNAAPSGTEFIAPDGSRRRKP